MLDYFCSYSCDLIRFLQEKKPKKIIEWGTGISTRLMVCMLGDVEIWSIEHDEEWYNRWREDKELNGVNLYHIKLSEGYACMPLEEFGENYFDFAFIDGRKRVECMKMSKKVVRRGGHVMIHDAHRWRYNKGINLFKPAGSGIDVDVLKSLPFPLKQLFIKYCCNRTFVGMV